MDNGPCREHRSIQRRRGGDNGDALNIRGREDLVVDPHVVQRAVEISSPLAGRAITGDIALGADQAKDTRLLARIARHAGLKYAINVDLTETRGRVASESNMAPLPVVNRTSAHDARVAGT